MARYSLGSDDAELERLDGQAAFLLGPTRVLLEASGLAPGMRVLDLGTGLGHIARALAEIVGPSGAVVGLDIDGRMLEVARARSEHLTHVRFVEADATTWRGSEPFDAVVGRLILFHLPDPVAVLRHHVQALRPGGRVVMLDYDIGGLRAEPADSLTEPMTQLVMRAFRAAGADPTIGARLREILAEAGVQDVGGFGVAQYLAGDDPLGPTMLTGVVRSLAPVMLAHGLATEAELGLDTLAARMTQSLTSAGSVLVPPILAGAWGRRPTG